MPVRPDLSRRRLLGLGAGLGAAVLLGGCGGDEAAPTTGAATPSGKALEPYTVRTCVYAKNHASSALYWQQFAPEGITVEVVPVKSAIEVQDGLESGQLDFGLLAPYTPIIAITQDPASITSKIVGMISRGGLGLVGRAGEVETVADLRGKKLAVPPPTLQVLVLNDALREAGLRLGQDVEAVPLGFADHVTAFERGDVDAFMGTEPLVTQAVVGGGGVRLEEVTQTPVGDFNTANWASAKVLGERPDVVRAVTRMQRDAAQLLSPDGDNDPEQWRELLVEQFGFAEPVYDGVLDHIGARWKFDDERVAQVEAAATMLVQQGGIAREPDLEPLFAREYWDV
ncbi:MAG: NrtA/SsuA/CpmA family ABC transporter substrate-binding protein [Actinomycetota bacterium]|nr:NrtA/SsuA/CpmA family ABC transporter substrate-binding protein [Actinomycetota bacterium]